MLVLNVPPFCVGQRYVFSRETKALGFEESHPRGQGLVSKGRNMWRMVKCRCPWQARNFLENSVYPRNRSHFRWREQTNSGAVLSLGYFFLAVFVLPSPSLYNNRPGIRCLDTSDGAMDEDGDECERGRRSMSSPTEHKGRAGLPAHHGEDAVHRSGYRPDEFFLCVKKGDKGNHNQKGNYGCGSCSGGGVFGDEPGGGGGRGAENRTEAEDEDGEGVGEEEEPDACVGSNSSSGKVVEVWKTDGGRRTPRLLN